MQDVAHPVDALEEIEVDPAHGRHRLEPFAVGVPHESIGRREVLARRRRRREPVERVGDAQQQGREGRSWRSSKRAFRALRTGAEPIG